MGIANSRHHHIGAILARPRGSLPTTLIPRAIHMILLLFSTIVQNTTQLQPEARNSPATVREMMDTFQIIIWGFAREGEHSQMDITWAA